MHTITREQRPGPHEVGLACECFRPGFCEAVIVQVRGGRQPVRKLLRGFTTAMEIPMKTSKIMNLAALSAAVAMFGATAAEAHAKLLSSNPVANATVAAPKQLVLKFSEKLQPR